MGMIMPSVFEGMLNFLIINLKSDLHRWYEDPSWKGAWIRFARTLLPENPPPDYVVNETDDAEFLRDASEWIGNVVTNYSDSKALSSNLIDLGGAE